MHGSSVIISQLVKFSAGPRVSGRTLHLRSYEDHTLPSFSPYPSLRQGSYLPMCSGAMRTKTGLSAIISSCGGTETGERYVWSSLGLIRDYPHGNWGSGRDAGPARGGDVC